MQGNFPNFPGYFSTTVNWTFTAFPHTSQLWSPSSTSTQAVFRHTFPPHFSISLFRHTLKSFSCLQAKVLVLVGSQARARTRNSCVAGAALTSELTGLDIKFNEISSIWTTVHPQLKKNVTKPGLEPATSGSEPQRLINWAIWDLMKNECFQCIFVVKRSARNNPCKLEKV